MRLCMYAHIRTYLPTLLPIHPSIHLSIYLLIYLSFVYLSIYPSIDPIDPSIYLILPYLFLSHPLGAYPIVSDPVVYSIQYIHLIWWYHILYHPILSYVSFLILPYPIRQDPIIFFTFYLILLIIPYPVLSYLILSDLILSDRVLSYPILYTYRTWSFFLHIF